MSNRYAVIFSGVVENTILLDDPSDWPIPAGRSLVKSDAGSIGDAWNGTVFTPPTPAPLTPAQTLAVKLSAGIAITSTGTSAISATYALDATTLDQIGSVARDAASGLGLPQSAATFTYPDINSTPRTLTSANVQALYKAMRDLVASLNEQAAILAAGGSPTWPQQAATIA